MLLFACEEHHLKVNSDLPLLRQISAQLLVVPTDGFQFDWTTSRNTDRIFFVLTAPERQRRDHYQSHSAGHRDVEKTTL